MSEVIIAPSSELINDRLHNWRDEGGWYFGAGEPEFWKFSDRLLVPDGRLLDIGIGLGRTSLYFALHGMEVVGVEKDPNKVKEVNEMVDQLSAVVPCKLKSHELDALTGSLPRGGFDTVIIGQVVHLSSKQAAYNLFDKAVARTKVGGHIWVRGAGKESYAYDELMWEAVKPYQFDVKMVDEDVIEHPCDCSGEYLIEPTLFFDQLDLLNFFSQNGCQVVHNQTIPTMDKQNIMYGEDYNPERYTPYGGFVTVLAQKK